MKNGEKYYCIKDRYQDYECMSSKLINKSGKFYEIKMFNPSFDPNTIWLDNEKHEGGYFYVLKHIKHSHYIFSDYFISLKESRMLRLDKINENIL